MPKPADNFNPHEPSPLVDELVVLLTAFAEEKGFDLEKHPQQFCILMNRARQELRQKK